MNIQRALRDIGAAIVLSGLSGAGTVAEASEARTSTAIVELFTSQGCSSCPPADRLLADLSNRQDVIALTFPVDYWDYLGWKDTLAKAAYTARQKRYAVERGDGQVYTPQMVVNGVVHAVGSRGHEVDAAIKTATRAIESARVPLTAKIDGNTLKVAVGAAPAGSHGNIWVAHYRRTAAVAVKRGENAGSDLTYTNVVRRLERIGSWRADPQTIDVELGAMQPDKTLPADGCVVFLQAGIAGPIVAAFELRNIGVGF